MIYGVLKPGEKERMIRPGRGHEEILVSVKGRLTVTGHYNGLLDEGDAFHLAEDQACFLENRGECEAVYVVAGGHSGQATGIKALQMKLQLYPHGQKGGSNT